MAEETNVHELGKVSNKRRIGNNRNKGFNDKKKSRPFQRTGEHVKKVDGRMKKLYRKRARDYNSDDDDNDDVGDGDNRESAARVAREDNAMSRNKSKVYDRNFRGREKDLDEWDDVEENEVSEEENEDADDEIQPGITKFTEGCRAFKIAFKKIIKKKVSTDSLGPVLSGHKELIAEKLAEDEAERKTKGEAKKEKQLVAEKGHAKPANFLDSHEKFLIGVATKGAVKLFNAVNKAQNAKKGLDPSRFKDAKALKKQRKEAFFSELRKSSSVTDSNPFKAPGDGEGPAWAPLRDNYMLTNSKLKDWDKMQGNVVSDDIGRMTQDSCSDDDSD